MCFFLPAGVWWGWVLLFFWFFGFFYGRNGIKRGEGWIAGKRGFERGMRARKVEKHGQGLRVPVWSPKCLASAGHPKGFPTWLAAGFPTRRHQWSPNSVTPQLVTLKGFPTWLLEWVSLGPCHTVTAPPHTTAGHPKGFPPGSDGWFPGGPKMHPVAPLVAHSKKAWASQWLPGVNLATAGRQGWLPTWLLNTLASSSDCLAPWCVFLLLDSSCDAPPAFSRLSFGCASSSQ